jgi:hypothetical protein
MKQHLSTIFGQSVRNTVLPAMESYIGFRDWNTNAFQKLLTSLGLSNQHLGNAL